MRFVINICLAFPMAATPHTSMSLEEQAEFLATHWMSVKQLEDAGEV
jgi:hypothetical protein